MKVERLETGSEPIDSFLKGGIERGIVTNVFGESGSGKTNFCIQVAANVCENGDKAVYIDTEKGFSPERFTQIASDEALENIVVNEPVTFEEQVDAIMSLESVVEKHDPEIIIVDSLVSLYRLQATGDKVQKVNQTLSQLLSHLSKIARKEEIPVLVTNQVYTSFDEDDLELVGRDVPRYWSKCLLKLSTVEQGIRKAEIEKHRSMPEGKSRRFKITDDGLMESDGEGIF
ncbi:MAG: DNA repair and recombination protein RadB [Nanohaloarchaea archaeon]|nr:DNA repair and recombination protein RadB [Candidatus Nanohaloarchaea archaeon]